MEELVDEITKEIEKWGAISTAVPSAVALVGLLVIIGVVVQFKKLRRSNVDLKDNLARLQAELQNLGMALTKRHDEHIGYLQRLDQAVATMPQTIINQLSTLSRKDYNEEILTRSSGLLPTRGAGPPVPPKRANSYFKPTYY